MSGAWRARLIPIVFVVAVLRFVFAVAGAVHANRGDFAATLPGAYAEEWNPTLWDSADLDTSETFERHGYIYGPTQYLTLWPIVFLDSYAQIAAVLLPLYVLVVCGVGYVLWRLCDVLAEERGHRLLRALSVVAVVLLFAPLQAALGQREFETVQALILVLAAFCLTLGRDRTAGALLGYISLFKYWTASLLIFLVLKRRWNAVVAFVAAVACVLLATHLVFDLGRFAFTSAEGIDAQFGRFYTPVMENLPFCAPVAGTAANLHTGLCAITGGRDRVAAALFYGGIAAAALAFSALFLMLEWRKGNAGDVDGRWRQLLEFCLFLTGAGVILHGHYYYLAVLVLPLGLVIYRNLWASSGTPIKLALALLAYLTLSPFVVPIPVVARLTGGDPWAFYLRHGVYAYGIVIVAGLLLWEYWDVLRRRSAAGIALTMLFAIVSSGCARPVESSACTFRFSIPEPPGARFSTRQIPAVSPDGADVAYTAAGADGIARAWIQSLRRASVKAVPGSEGATFPFWSPDGRHLAFFADGHLKRVEIGSGAVQVLADARDPRGGAWSPRGVMVYSAAPANDADRAIFSVPAGGGAVTRLTNFAHDVDGGYSWPAFLFDGDHFVYSSVGEDTSRVFFGSLRSPEHVSLMGASSPAVPAGSRLLLAAGQALVSVPFDRKVLHAGDEAKLVAQGVARGPARMASFSASSDGSTIVYGQAGTAIVWLDGAGHETPAVPDPGAYSPPILSPSRDDLLVSTASPWSGFESRFYGVYEPRRDRWRQIEVTGADRARPLWSGDGSEILFTTSDGVTATIGAVRMDGGGATRTLFTAGDGTYAAAVAPGADLIALVETAESSGTHSVVRVVSSSATGAKTALWHTADATTAYAPALSADGAMIAYVVNDAGREDVYVADLRAQHAPVRISTHGGASPVWAASGRQLLYRNRAGIFAVDTGGPPAAWSARERLVLDGALLRRGRYLFDQFDVSRDGTKILLLKSPDPDVPAPLVVLAACGRSLPKAVFP